LIVPGQAAAAVTMRRRMWEETYHGGFFRHIIQMSDDFSSALW
jgi:hypothetical protein